MTPDRPADARARTRMPAPTVARQRLAALIARLRTDLQEKQ